MAGFKHIGTESQGDVSGKIKRFWVNSSSIKIGVGDVVVITGDAHSTKGIQGVDQGVANTANTGVVVGVEPQFSGESLSTTYLGSSTEGYVYVNTDPHALYEVEVANGPLTAAQAGLNVPLVNTEGTVSGGLFTSNNKVNATGIATTSTLPFRVVKILEDSDGTYGNKAVVRVNESTSNLGATGIS